MKIQQVAEMLKDLDIKLKLWSKGYAECNPKEKIVFLPMRYLNQDNLSQIALALLHEVQHIQRTTYDSNKLAKTKEEAFILNCVEDARIDKNLMDTYDLRPTYRKIYLEKFKEKGFKRTVPLFEQIALTTLLFVVNFANVVKASRKVLAFIKKEKLIARYLKIMGLLDKLEVEPTTTLYKKTREEVEDTTDAIIRFTDKE